MKVVNNGSAYIHPWMGSHVSRGSSFYSYLSSQFLSAVGPAKGVAAQVYRAFENVNLWFEMLNIHFFSVKEKCIKINETS